MADSEMVSKTELHKQLSNYPSTDNWDVLVSYSPDELNKQLKKYWGNAANTAKCTFTRKEGPAHHELEMVYDLTLGAPALEFNTDKAIATLIMPISGTVAVKDDPPEWATKIDGDRCKLQIEVPLASVSGEEGATPASSDTIVSFDDDKTATQHIIFHFVNKSTTWNVKMSNPDDPALKLMKDAAENLATYYSEKLQEIDYSLAQISNEKNEHSDLLRPSKFVFGAQKGALNVFIKTKGGVKEGRSNPRFGLDKTCPIPKNFTVSIIISRDFFRDQYLVKQIQDNCPNLAENGVEVDKSAKIDSGIALQLKFVEFGDFGLKRWGHDTKFNAKKLENNLSNTPVHLKVGKVGDDDLDPKYSWSWEATNKFQLKAGLFPVWPKFTVKIPEHSRTMMTVSTNSKINVELSFKDEDQPKVTYTQEEGLYLKLSTFDIKPPPLDFFMTQNIFAPNKTLINVSEVMLPSDLVLLGKIEES